MEESLKVR